MSTAADLIAAHWRHANARDWSSFGALLHPAMRYECPQTREFADGAVGYLEMFRTWPGDWRAEVQRLFGSADEAVSVVRFCVGDEVMTGLSLFTLQDGLIRQVTDYWPEDYEPPARATPHLQRRPA